MKPTSFPSFATVGQVARAVGCSPHIVRVLADSGRLLHFRDYNGWRRFTDLDSAVEVAAEQIRRGKGSESLAAEDGNETTGE